MKNPRNFNYSQVMNPPEIQWNFQMMMTVMLGIITTRIRYGYNGSRTRRHFEIEEDCKGQINCEETQYKS
jgi:hypothetical protein